MAKRAFDLLAALLLLLISAPAMLIAALGIRLSSPGPILYRAQRAGRGGATFTMLKFRTMHAEQGPRPSAITATGDPRVFPFGSFLRRTKLDELPQLWHVLTGRMSIVGPRPEDPRIVREHYTEDWRETLRVRPGLASPGSLYNYTHGDALLAGADAERAYVERLLPPKMALERVYVRRAGLLYDLWIIARTALVIAAIAAGKRDFADPPEMAAARRMGLL
jgi:lipopolysaccharide/colanic/teichoic acid biosynthesis glycosyltransferase